MIKKEHIIEVFLDFSKAVDCVNHKILFRKLNHYGIRGTALNLLESYSSDRHQNVQYNNSQSQSKPLKHSVPKGSTLGPLIFDIYIDDIVVSVQFLHAFLFTDDSCFYSSGSDLLQLINIVNIN